MFSMLFGSFAAYSGLDAVCVPIISRWEDQLAEPMAILSVMVTNCPDSGFQPMPWRQVRPMDAVVDRAVAHDNQIPTQFASLCGAPAEARFPSLTGRRPRVARPAETWFSSLRGPRPHLALPPPATPRYCSHRRPLPITSPTTPPPPPPGYRDYRHPFGCCSSLRHPLRLVLPPEPS